MTLFQETVFTRGVNMMRCRFRYRCPLSHGFRRVSWNGISDEPTQVFADTTEWHLHHASCSSLFFVDVWSDENLGHIQPDTIEPSASWSQKHNNDIHPSMTELWARAQSSGKALRISSNRLWFPLGYQRETWDLFQRLFWVDFSGASWSQGKACWKWKVFAGTACLGDIYENKCPYGPCVHCRERTLSMAGSGRRDISHLSHITQVY